MIFGNWGRFVIVMPVHVSDSCEQPLGELKQRRFGQKPGVLDRNSQKRLVPADHFVAFGNGMGAIPWIGLNRPFV